MPMQPRVRANLHGKIDPARDFGSGLPSTGSAGLAQQSLHRRTATRS